MTYVRTLKQFKKRVFLLYTLFTCDLSPSSVADPRFLGLPDPDPLVRGMDPDPVPALDPDPDPLVRGMDPDPDSFIHNSKIVRKTLIPNILLLFWTFYL